MFGRKTEQTSTPVAKDPENVVQILNQKLDECLARLDYLCKAQEKRDEYYASRRIQRQQNYGSRRYIETDGNGYQNYMGPPVGLGEDYGR